MEEKVIKAATVMITAISIIVAGTLLFFPQLHIRAEALFSVKVMTANLQFVLISLWAEAKTAVTEFL